MLGLPVPELFFYSDGDENTTYKIIDDQQRLLKTFAEDHVCDQQTEELHKDFEEYPALSITIGEKLLSMLGLGKTTTVKKL